MVAGCGRWLARGLLFCSEARPPTARFPGERPTDPPRSPSPPPSMVRKEVGRGSGACFCAEARPPSAGFLCAEAHGTGPRPLPATQIVEPSGRQGARASPFPFSFTSTPPNHPILCASGWMGARGSFLALKRDRPAPDSRVSVRPALPAPSISRPPMTTKKGPSGTGGVSSAKGGGEHALAPASCRNQLREGATRPFSSDHRGRGNPTPWGGYRAGSNQGNGGNRWDRNPDAGAASCAAWKCGSR